MVKIGVHLQMLSQNKAGVPLFGPLCMLLAVVAIGSQARTIIRPAAVYNGKPTHVRGIPEPDERRKRSAV